MQESQMITENDVLNGLRSVIDPDFNKDIVTLGFIHDMKIKGGEVSFTVRLTTPACPVREQFKTQCEQVVSRVPGVTSVRVTMDAMKPQSQGRQTISTLTDVGTLIAVSSCKGGVGKSTIAAHMARGIQREGHTVGLLDADVYGPSIPTLFNRHRPDIYVEGQMLLPVDVDGLKVMSLGFVLGDAPAVLRGPMVSGYIQQILHQTKWGKLDYLIIDLPPGTGDIQLTLVQQAALDGAVIVTTPQTLSLVDVARGILMFEKVNVPVLGLVENMSHFVCDNCEKKHYIFGQGAQTLQQRFGIPTLAEFPIIPGISNLEDAQAGADLAEVRELTENLHRAVGMRRLDKGARPEVEARGTDLVVRWPDGREDVLKSKDVRASCQCALCIEEFTGKKLLEPASIPDDVHAEAITPLGNYAVGINWSDGHTSGIYSWDHLRQVADQVGAS
jgi:ATP-binding protein involved in chromosome partitioning